YQVRDEFPYAWNCHCSRCRAATGSAFKALAGIERDKLERPAWGPGSHQVTRAQLHDALGHVDADVPAELVRTSNPSVHRRPPAARPAAVRAVASTGSRKFVQAAAAA